MCYHQLCFSFFLNRKAQNQWKNWFIFVTLLSFNFNLLYVNSRIYVISCSCYFSLSLLNELYIIKCNREVFPFCLMFIPLFSKLCPARISKPWHTMHSFKEWNFTESLSLILWCFHFVSLLHLYLIDHALQNSVFPI